MAFDPEEQQADTTTAKKGQTKMKTLLVILLALCFSCAHTLTESPPEPIEDGEEMEEVIEE